MKSEIRAKEDLSQRLICSAPLRRCSDHEAGFAEPSAIMVYLFGPRSTATVRSRGLRGESGEVLGLRGHQDNLSIQVTSCASCRVSPRCRIHVAAALQVSILQGLVLSNMAWQYINRAFALWYPYP